MWLLSMNKWVRSECNDRIVIVCTSAPQMVAGALNQYCTLSQPCTCWVWAEDNGCCVAGCQCDILSSKTITVSQTRICDTMSSLLWRAVLVSVLGACACVTCFGNGHHSTSFKNGHQRIKNSPSRQIFQDTVLTFPITLHVWTELIAPFKNCVW